MKGVVPMRVEKENISELFGIQGWTATHFHIVPWGVVFDVDRERHSGYVCGKCGEVLMFVYDHCPERTIRDFPVWGRRSFLRFRQARVVCPKCGVTHEKLDWVEPYQHMTVRYEKYLASLCDFMPVSDVAEIEGVCKDTLYRIDKKWLQWRRQFAVDAPVRLLGIDEIAIGRRSNFATVFYDLEHSRVVALVKGRKQRNASHVLRRWGRERCLAVEAVCCDLWAAFHNSVRLYLKNAALVFDKFHVFKYLSDAIDDVRRGEQAKAEKDGRQILKGARWILLKKNLKLKERRTLEEVMRLNEPIAKAMVLKDEFELFYQAETSEEALDVLVEWCGKCRESGLKPFTKLAKRLMRWKDGILAYFKCRITNAISEGVNNKIKVIKRRSYGFHDIEYFFNKILQATGTLPKMLSLCNP
jgi:transposase